MRFSVFGVLVVSLILLQAYGLVTLLAAQTPEASTAGPPPARMSEAEAIEAIKAELDKRVAAEQFSGAVLIAKAGKPIFEQAYGYADREKRIPNTVETKFFFGSMAKMFTGVAVMQLVEAGKVRVEDPLSKYLPDYPNKEVAAVTIHQLLTHTGGTGDFFGPEFETHRLELRELKDYVALFGNRAPKFPPGSQYEYSNYGMILAGRVVEVASGERYHDYVRDHIFKPAGMNSTSTWVGEDPVPGLAIPYTRFQPGEKRRGPGSELATGPLQARTDMRFHGTSAGGGYSTVGDFLRFATALTSHKLLSARYTELVTTGKVEAPPRLLKGPMPAGIAKKGPPPGGVAKKGPLPAGSPKYAYAGIPKYAYGFTDARTPDGVRTFGHGGGSAGLNGRLAIYPESQYVVAVLANLDHAADELARFIEPRLPLK